LLSITPRLRWATRPRKRVEREGVAHVFPRPRSRDDIIGCDDDEPLARLGLHELLLDPRAEEWWHKVGPTSPTRLLLSGGWVFKTRTCRRAGDLEAARARARDSAQRTRRLGVWHPRKRWFVLRADGEYWPCNVSLRQWCLKRDRSPDSAGWRRPGSTCPV
jgi:hypothetical protein